MEATIGFDLRLTAPDPSWTADRRALHLLRRDVPLVRSVDAEVWERPPGLPPSPEVGGLWPDLPGLLAAARALDRADVVVVRITALEQEEGIPDDLDLIGSAFERQDLLGYDVADYYLMSGLANCGYWSDEVASLASAWVPLLNEWHLFGKPADASAYAEVTDRRVPEHEPFYAYGIYQLH